MKTTAKISRKANLIATVILALVIGLLSFNSFATIIPTGKIEKTPLTISSNSNGIVIKGFGVSQVVTGSLLGARTSLGLSIGNRNQTLDISSIGKIRSMPISGVQLKYRYNITQSLETTELYAFSSIMYDANGTLNKNTINQIYNHIENKANSLYKTLEVYGGFGLKFNILSFVSLNSSIGIGYYASKIKGDDRRPSNYSRFRLDNAMSLSVSSGIFISF